MLKNLKNAEFSKKLLYFVTDMIVLTFVVVIISIFLGMGEPLVVFITGLFSLATIAFGFYYWKAKAENINKYAKAIDKETMEKIVSYYDHILCDKEDNEP